MPSDFEAQVRNDLRAIQVQVESLSRSTGKLNNETRRYGDAAGQAFRRGRTEITSTSRAAEGLGRSIGQTSQALGKMGGPLGEIIGRLGGGAGMAGGLGKVAAGAALAGIALKAFNAIVDKNLESARDAVEVHLRMAKAMEAAGEATKKLAAAGLGQAGARRSLLAAGGEGAVRDADAVEKDGIATAEEAAQGVASINNAFGRFGKRAGNRAPALAIARDLAAGGMPFAQASAAVGEAQGDLNNPDVARRVKGSIFAKFSGVNGAHQGNLALGLAQESIANDSLLKTSRANLGVRAQTADLEEGAAVAGGTAAARADLAAAAAPVATATSAGYQQSQEGVEVLRLIYEETKKQSRDQLLHSRTGVGYAAAKLAELKAEQAYLKAQRAAGRGLVNGPGG